MFFSNSLVRLRRRCKNICLSSAIFIVQHQRMQKLFTLLLVLLAGTLHAQTGPAWQPVSKLDNVQIKDSTVNPKWFVSRYSGLSASFISFRGGSAMMYSAPMGIQLNRTINNNLYAFAGVEIAPGYINFNQRFVQNDFTKNGFSNSFMQGNNNQFSLNPAAFVGLGYTNDERTFQIQARVNVSQGNSFYAPRGFGNFYGTPGQMNSIIHR
jgi:hypothetical protein